MNTGLELLAAIIIQPGLIAGMFGRFAIEYYRIRTRREVKRKFLAGMIISALFLAAMLPATGAAISQLPSITALNIPAIFVGALLMHVLFSFGPWNASIGIDNGK